jgi:hypothetical protein
MFFVGQGYNPKISKQWKIWLGISHAALAPALRVRASFSQERMTYFPEDSKVVYRSKDGKEEKTFDALEWLGAMCSHVPNKGEEMVRYYGYYSNVSRGKRQKEDQDGLIPYILEPGGSSKARLVRLIFLFSLRLRTIPDLSFQVYITGDRSGPERTGQD